MRAGFSLLFRYSDPDGKLAPDRNPNGAERFIAGVLNDKGNVCGLMPHPERASEEVLGNRDGIRVFESIVQWFTK